MGFQQPTNLGTRACYLVDRSAGFELVISGGRKAVFSPHTHVSSFTFLLVRKGKLLLRMKGCGRELAKGGTAVIAPHLPHSIRAEGPYEMVSVCVDAALFRSGPEGQNVAAGPLADAVAGGHLRKSERKILLALFRGVGAPPSETGDAVTRLKNRLEKHPERETCLADMAASSHIGEGHLIRKFKKRYGLTPRGFLNQCRLRKAKRNFMGGGSLVQTALLAGFYDQSHFIKYFKKYHGLTPRQYLRARTVTG